MKFRRGGACPDRAAGLVEIGDFGRGERAVVDADVVDLTIEIAAISNIFSNYQACSSGCGQRKTCTERKRLLDPIDIYFESSGISGLASVIHGDVVVPDARRKIALHNGADHDTYTFPDRHTECIRVTLIGGPLGAKRCRSSR